MESNKLIEKFNQMVETYENTHESKSGKVTLIDEIGNWYTITNEAYDDPEIRKIFNEIINLQELEHQAKIQKLAELGNDEINRLLDEHTVSYKMVNGEKYREVDDRVFCKNLMEAQALCEEQNKKTR